MHRPTDLDNAQHNIAFEGTLRGINVGKGCPASAGGRAQGTVMQGSDRRWASNLPASNTFPAGCQHCVTAAASCCRRARLLAAIELKLSIRRCKTNGFKISCQVLA